MLTLWDIIEPVVGRVRPRPGRSRGGNGRTRAVAPVPALAPAPAPMRVSGAIARKKGGSAGMQARYDAVVAEMLDVHEIRVRKWRTSMTGIAWYVTYKDGRVVRLIEAPRPRGPMSAAVFLHEVGHHAIGFNTYKPRCLEEYHAWAWAIRTMESSGLNITDAVHRRMHASLWYAVQKARRRGIRSIPSELTPYLDRPQNRRSA